MGNTGSSKKSHKKNSKKAAQRQRNKIILFVAEIFVLVVLGLVVWAVFKGTDEESGVQKINVAQEDVISDEIVSYLTTFSQKRCRMAATCALVAFPVGSRLRPIPVMRPLALAHAKESRA